MGAGAADSEAENGNGVDENSGSNKSENSESVSGQENGLPELGGLGTENELQEAEIKENDVRNKLDNPDFSENKSPSELDGTPLEHAQPMSVGNSLLDTPMPMASKCSGTSEGTIQIDTFAELQECLQQDSDNATFQLQNNIEATTSITFGSGQYTIDMNGYHITANFYGNNKYVFQSNEETTSITFKNNGTPGAAYIQPSDTTSSYKYLMGLMMTTGEKAGSTLIIDDVDFNYFHAQEDTVYNYDNFPDLSIYTLAAAVTVVGTEGHNPTVNIKNSNFANNYGKTSGNNNTGGGAIALNNANAVIENNVFSDNLNTTGGAIYISGDYGDSTTTTVDIKQNQFNNNAAQNNSTNGGGAIYAVNLDSLTIEGNNFNGNSSLKNGGAIVASNINTITMTDNTIENSSAKALGGGVYVEESQTLNFEDNIVQNNVAADASTYGQVGGGGLYIIRTISTSLINNQIIGNRAEDGGGIYYTIASTEKRDIRHSLTMDKNHINENFAAKSGIENCRNTLNGVGCGEGGGLYLGLGGNNEAENTVPVTLDIKSGEFIGNQAADGGGIYYGIGWFYKDGNLNLYNALITGNTATRGGGIWLCAKAQVEMYSTDGSVIVGNTATGSLGFPWSAPTQAFGSEGDDIFYIGSYDTKSGDPQYTGVAPRTLLEVTSRSWSGFPIDWYKDELGHRYSEGYRDYLPPNSPYLVGENGKGTQDLTALHGDFDYLDEANKTASLIIANNVAARRGGGIFSNNVMTFGRANADVELTVEKEFVKDGAEVETEELLLESITVALYRINEDGEEEQIDTTELTAAGNWSHTFEELPSEGFYSGKFSYRVVEQAVDNWELASAESTNPNQAGEGNTCTYDTKGGQLACMIKLTNSYVTPPETPETPNSPDTGSFTIEGVAEKTGANISQVANFWMTLVVAVTAGLIVARKKRYI